MALTFVLSFEGGDASDHRLDFYDAAVALLGFQRSLAITSHYVLNDKVITQAPSLSGARIMVAPPFEGSWRMKADVEPQQPSATTAESYGAPTEEALSATYDYVVGRTLGFQTDFDSDVGPLIEAIRPPGRSDSKPTSGRLDAVIEKCEVGIKDMHRPIVQSQSADTAKIISSVKPRSSFRYSLSQQTYQHILEGLPDLRQRDFVGKVSSYNLNTYRGRIFLPNERRPVPFELREAARTPSTISAILQSMSANHNSSREEAGMLRFRAVPYETRTGRLRSLELVAAA